MDPQCHPELSKAVSEADLQAEQDEFFLSGAANSVTLKNTDSFSNSNSRLPVVLDDVVERPINNHSAPCAPIMRAAVKPTLIARPSTISVQNSELVAADIDQLKEQVSHENDEKLAKMSVSQIEELKRELFESVPESFLNKLRKN